MEESLVQPQHAGTKRTESSVSAQVLRYSALRTQTTPTLRRSTGMQEFDRVLGGGIVKGSVVLIGGEPGIGKSTLLTHLSLNILNYHEIIEKAKTKKNEQKEAEFGLRILYVAGEESPEQIGLRVARIGGGSTNAWADRLLFLTTTDVDAITNAIAIEKPDLVIVDSIQTLSTQDLSGATGSLGQLKECTDRLTRMAKAEQIPIFLVGHVTKEGSIAGPKVLEHMVDTVLELSGERTGQYRILRAIKNRFGATDEVGIFVHTEQGLEEVTNPSAAFLEERVAGSPGSALASVIEGTRPILIEVQALVIRSEIPVPRRVARGVPMNKLQVIVAVLEKYCGLQLGTCDVFVNIAGGLTISEPAVDLAIAVACASSYQNRATKPGTIFVGEVGLLGEVRKIKLLEKRTKESIRLGFPNLVGPGEVRSVRQALEFLLPKKGK